MKRTIEQVTCDGCDSEVLCRDFATIASFGTEMHLCRACLKSFRDDVEKEYRRVIHGQEPDRRGGWRNLGEYDG